MTLDTFIRALTRELGRRPDSNAFKGRALSRRTQGILRLSDHFQILQCTCRLKLVLVWNSRTNLSFQPGFCRSAVPGSKCLPQKCIVLPRIETPKPNLAFLAFAEKVGHWMTRSCPVAMQDHHENGTINTALKTLTLGSACINNLKLEALYKSKVTLNPFQTFPGPPNVQGEYMVFSR